MLTDFQNLSTNRFISEYATTSSLIISPHLKHIAALPCETSISENYQKSDARIVTNDKSQGSVATRFRCVGLFSNYFTTDLLLKFADQTILGLKSVNIWQSYRQELTNRPVDHLL